MQAKYCLLFVLLIGSIVVSTDGFSPVGKVGKETCTVKCLMSVCVLVLTTVCSSSCSASLWIKNRFTGLRYCTVTFRHERIAESIHLNGTLKFQ